MFGLGSGRGGGGEGGGIFFGSNFNIFMTLSGNSKT